MMRIAAGLAALWLAAGAAAGQDDPPEDIYVRIEVAPGPAGAETAPAPAPAPPALVVRLWPEEFGLAGARVVAAGRSTIEWRDGRGARLRAAGGAPLSAAVRAELRATVPDCRRGAVSDLTETVDPGGTVVLRWDCVWLQ